MLHVLGAEDSDVFIQKEVEYLHKLIEEGKLIYTPHTYECIYTTHTHIHIHTHTHTHVYTIYIYICGVCVCVCVCVCIHVCVSVSFLCVCMCACVYVVYTSRGVRRALTNLLTNSLPINGLSSRFNVPNLEMSHDKSGHVSG